MWSTFICISFSSWLSFHPIPTGSKGPEEASLSWTVLVRLPLAEDETAFTFRLFLRLLQKVSHGLCWKGMQLQEAATAERREGNQQLLSGFGKGHLRNYTCAFSFNLLINPLWGVLLSSLCRQGNSCSEQLGNLPQITGLKEDRNDT